MCLRGSLKRAERAMGVLGEETEREGSKSSLSGKTRCSPPEQRVRRAIGARSADMGPWHLPARRIVEARREPSFTAWRVDIKLVGDL